MSTNIRRLAAVLGAVLLVLAGSDASASVGWAPTVEVDSSTGAYYGSESTCEYHPPTHKVVCVYTGDSADPNDARERLDLYYRVSNDGGVTFVPTRFQITSDAGDEYDPFLEYDPTRNRFVLIYSKWHEGGNAAVTRFGTPVAGTDTIAWSSPTCVSCVAGANYWDASVLHLNGGALLALLTVEGPEGNANGRIESRRSIDGGATWTRPAAYVIADTCMDEEQPVATQNPDGAIRVLYRNRGYSTIGQAAGRCLNLGAGDADTWQAWSTDGGETWLGYAGFRQTSGPDLFTFLGTQGGSNQTVMMILRSSDGTYAPYHMQSNDYGLTFSAPSRTAESSFRWNSWENIDPGFTVGCRGFVSNFTSAVHVGVPSKLYLRRFNASDTC